MFFFQKGETIAEIPFKLLITRSHPELIEIKNQIQNLSNELDSDYVTNFSLWLIRGRKLGFKNSFFSSYFDTLPISMDNFPPLYNKKEELDLLNTSKFLKKSREDYLVKFQKDYEVLKKHNIIDPNQVTLNDLMEGAILYESRNFMLQDKNDQGFRAIIPIVDFFNYDNKSNQVTFYFDGERDHYIIYAKGDIKKGEEVSYLIIFQIVLDYGDHDKAYYLNIYGFTTPKIPRADLHYNSSDGYEISLKNKVNVDEAVKNIKLDENKKKQYLLDFLKAELKYYPTTAKVIRYVKIKLIG